MAQRGAGFDDEEAARSPADGRGRQMLWLAVLVAASVAFSRGLACAAPLAAFAAAGALTLKRRDALLLIAAVWLANQFVGYLFLSYPWTAESFAWGVVLGAVALGATAAAQAIVRRLGRIALPVVVAAAFGGAFAVYEGGLFVVSAAWLGGTENYTPAIVGWIFAVNALAFAGFLAAHRLAMTIGLAARPATRLFAAPRPATSAR